MCQALQDCTLPATYCCNEILQPIRKPFDGADVDEIMLTLDNACVHIVRICMDFLNEKRIGYPGHQT